MSPVRCECHQLRCECHQLRCECHPFPSLCCRPMGESCIHFFFLSFFKGGGGGGGGGGGAPYREIHLVLTKRKTDFFFVLA